MQTNARSRVLKARERIARQNSFFAGIIYNAKIVESLSAPGGTPTMWTNGVHIFYHPDFIRDNNEHIEGVFLHEVLHCALNHVVRGKNKHGMGWNIACDWAVNPLVVRNFTLPKYALFQPSDAPKNVSAERLYDWWLKQKQEQKEVDEINRKKQKESEESESEGGGNSGDESDDNPTPESSDKSKTTKSDDGDLDRQGSAPMQEPTSEELEQAERDWKRIVNKAADTAQKAGDMPAQARRLLDELKPVDNLDWKSLIEELAKNARSNRSGSWSRPNRRYTGTGYRMPGAEIDNVYRLVVCLDCSGSVNDSQHAQMKAEIINLLESKLITNATLMAVDTSVMATADVDTAEGVESFMSPSGGGTDFRSAMEQVRNVEDAVGCIFLTDMQTGDYGRDPGMPVVWVNWCPNYGHAEPSFGKVVPYETGE